MYSNQRSSQHFLELRSSAYTHFANAENSKGMVLFNYIAPNNVKRIRNSLKVLALDFDIIDTLLV